MSQVEVKNVRKSRFGSFVALLGVLSAFGAMSAQAQNFLINKKFVNVVGVPNTQVNVLGPGQTSYLEFNMFNSSTGTLVANMIDTLPAGITGDPSFTPVVTDWTGAVGANGCVPGAATLTATASTISISNFSYPNTPAAGIRPDCRIVFRVIGNPAALPVGQSNVTNTVPSAATSATGPGGPYASDAFSASLQVLPIINAALSKAFSPTTVAIGGNSVMTFTISNNATYSLNNATLTDAVPAGVEPQTTPAPTSSCGGSVAVSGQNVTLTGGTIAASGSCTVTVTVKALVGAPSTAPHTNTIPANALTTAEGVTNSALASAPLIVLDTLTIEKFHDGSSTVTKTPGQVISTRVRFTNYSTALTNATLTDNLPAGLVLAANPNPVSYCGGTAAAVAGASTFTMTGMTIPAANLTTGVPGTCDVYFSTVVTAAATGTLENKINPSDVTNTQLKPPVAATSAFVTVVPTPGGAGAPNGGNWGSMAVQKGFASSGSSGGAYALVDQGQPFWLYLSAYNPSYDWRFTNGTITDILPLGVQVDVPAVPGGAPYTPVNGTDVTYNQWTGSPGQGANTLGIITSSYYPGCYQTGQVTVTRAANGQDTITYSGWTTRAMSELPAGSGASWYQSSCWINIRLKGITPGAYVGGAAPNQPINTIPVGNITVTEPGVTNPGSSTAPITILSDIGVSKTFNPHVLTGGAPAKITRLTIWMTNKSAAPQTSAALSDTLPTLSGWTVVIATPPNTATTCGGTVAATAGGTTVGIAGATIPAGTIAAPGKCSFSVDIAATGPTSDSGPLWNIIPPGALTTSTPNLTNIVEARASLYTRSRNIVLNKVFGNGGAAQGGTPVPMTITVTGDLWEMNNVSFSDDLLSVQPGLVIAPNPNMSTTCRTIDTTTSPFVWTDTSIFYQSLVAPTITAVAGATTISMSGAYFPGSDYIANGMAGQINSCTVTVDVVASTTGNKTNTIPANNVTTTEGATNASPTSATLTVQPNTQLVKAFTPTSVSAGTPFTLTFTIFNVNTSPQANFFVTDVLPAQVTATSVASNTCGGTVSVINAGGTIDLQGATSVAPNASCQYVVNVVSNTVGAWTNNQDNITASAVISKTTTTTVTVTAPVNIDLTIAKSITSSGPYTPGISQVTYSLVAKNNGPATAQGAIVVKDKLPAGLTAVSATGTNWSCTPQTGAAVEIVCTRAVGAGTLASGGSADPITVTASVDATASGTLVNSAQVNPSATETLAETNLLGTTNSGYEDGSPTTGSNNDDSKPITVAGLTYSVGNRVWNDNGLGGGTANDGLQNGTELGIDGVTVELLDGVTNAVIGASTTTANGGYYRFDNLPAGDYKVRITKPAGFINTTVPASGTTPNGNLDRDNNGAADAATTVTSNVVTLGPLLVEPINESDLVGGAAAGNAAANGGLDATGNMTVDFGLVQRIDLTIAKTITSAGPYTAGASNVTYSLVATNLGPATAQAAIVVKDKLPAGLTAVSATGTNWTCAPTTGAAVEIVCTRAVGAGTLPSGASADAITVTASVDATATGSLVNVAQVNPSATETIPESIPLGTTNTGYETGNPAVGSNNDDSKPITVTAATYSLGNRIWFDTNNDGILNNGETPAAGVKVQLLDSAGVPVVGQAVLTDSNGYYRFDGLNAGTYAAQVTPDNWTGISGSLPVGTTGSALVVLSGSTPLAGYQSSTGATAPNNTDHGIDPAGTYAAAGVKSANVTLGIGLQPTGEVDAGATGAGANATLGDAFDNLTVDFGFYRLTVGDTVWLDNGAGVPANYNNGIREAGEPVIQGVTVQLLKGATVVAVTTTDGGGNYIFTQQTNGAGAGTGEPLVAGTDYTINIPAGQTVLAGTKSSATPASQPAVNSVDKITLDDGDKGLGIASADSTATVSAAFTLGVSSTGASANANNTYGRAQTNVDNGTSHKPDMDFGFVPSFALGNRVWYDTNNNGVIDAAEQPINGVLVELTNSAGAKLYRTSSTDNTPTTTVTAGLAIEQTTANGGYYLFDNLPAGTFRVRVAASNWGSGQSLAGYANSTSATNAGASFVATDNNKDHGTDPTGTAAQQAAAYTANGVSSADILLGSSTVGTGDTTETGATIGTPPTSAAGNVNDNLTIDFGFYRLSVGNLVWSDSGSGGGVYNDGIRNGTEPGLDGVTVQLVDSNGNVVAQTLTSGGGNYSFNQLTSVPAVGTAGTPNGQPILPGNYTINIPPNQTPIAGATSSADTAGGRTNADSQDNGVGIALTTAATTSTAVALTPGGTAIGSTPNQVNGTTDQPRMDFGFAPGFAIGNRVWYDTNNNGVLDAGEVTVPNVLVELLDGNGVVIQTKATGPTGEYIFESLGTGNYTVRVAKENWIGITAGQVTAAGSPAGLAAGQKPLAGYNNSSGAGALTGTTTTDATDKGVDAADPTVAGISSATITLGAGLQPLNESATGDNDGVGTTTSIDANNNMTIDFGFYKLSVGDLVWKDDGNAGATPANINNGIFDAGEAGITGVRVELYKGSTLVAVTTTDGSGNYLFTQGTDSTGVANGKPLVPGTDYQVRIPQATASVNTPLINLLSSAAAAASETTPLGVNSDDSGVGTAAASAGITPSVNFTLGAGTASGVNSIPTNATGTTAQPNVDFGFAPSYSLGNRVWVDTNNDGLLNNAEVGLVGVTVTLLDGTGTPVPGVATQTTDSNGYYRFDNLPAGNYRVEIAPPPVNGVNYVSSTGQNASATGPYEAGLTSAATGTNNKDHGTQATPTTIRSGVVAVGPTALINGEVDAAAANAGANGPNGDAFDVLTVDFGIFLPAKLGNLVWFDVNKNGTADPAEPGLNNVSVILRDLNGVEIARQVTRNNPDTGNPGYYQFDYLIPGQYRVEFSAPGYFGTTPGTPSIVTGTGPDTNNSQIQPGRDLGTTQLVTLAPGDNNPQLDAGYIVPPVEVPTLSELMKLLLAMMMLSIGVIAVRTRQR